MIFFKETVRERNSGLASLPLPVGTRGFSSEGMAEPPRLNILCLLSFGQCLTPERKMEVEELSPVAQLSFLTPVERASEEDDGFVDILESDLKVNSLGPQGPLLAPHSASPEKDSSGFSKTMTSPQCQKNLRELSNSLR